MEAAFNRLLKQLSLNHHTPAIEGKLIELIIDKKTDTWLFNIEFKSPLPIETFKTFETRLEALKERLTHCKIIQASYDFETVHYQDLNDYYAYTLEKLIKHYPRFEAIRAFPVEVKDDRITLITPKDGGYVSQLLVPLEQALSRYGFQTTITMKLNEDASIQSRIEALEEAHIAYEPKVQSFIAFQEHRVGKIKHTIKDIPVSEADLNKTLSAYRHANYVFEGEVFNVTHRKIKGHMMLFTFVIGDQDDAIYVKKFVRDGEEIRFLENIEVGMLMRVDGRAEVDKYSHDVVITAQTIEHSRYLNEGAHRDDDAKEKRIEWHLHSKMSTLDGIDSIKDYVAVAKHFGHKALALTDHNGVQAFPEFYKAVKNSGIKPIFGAELNVVFEEQTTLYQPTSPAHEGALLDQTYVVFDIETTGLSNRYDDIIEISAVKLQGDRVVDRFDSFVYREEKLSTFTKKLTSINDLDLEHAPPIDEVIASFQAFIGNAILVAHNARFDVGFIEAFMQKFDRLERAYATIDTLAMARTLYANKLKRFNLKAVAKLFSIDLTQHHRAEADTEATVNIFKAMLHDLKQRGLVTLEQLAQPQKHLKGFDPYANALKHHVTVWAKNQAGMKQLYELISLANTRYFDKTPTLPFQVLEKHREHLLVGSGCMHSYFYELSYQQQDATIQAFSDKFDVIELPVVEDTVHVFENEYSQFDPIKQTVTIDETAREVYLKRLQETNQRLRQLAKEHHKPAIAIGDVHHIDKSSVKYRDIYIQTPVVGGGYHDLARVHQIPSQYYRTTKEMLEAFAYLGEEAAHEVVITTPNQLATTIEACQPFPKELFAPSDDFLVKQGIPSVEKALKERTLSEAYARYGNPLPPMVQARLDKELHAIITHRFSSVYYISYLLVKKSLDEGYLVGSRGSVGSSLVATLMGITEVNPLPPHYVCDHCHFTSFKRTPDEREQFPIELIEKPYQEALEMVSCGFDLRPLKCPHCQTPLRRDGHDIPFETFLGFKGDKVPDIDLNFSGDYQGKVHDYIREIFGHDRAFRAGTISTVADKTAFGYVKGYLEKQNLTLRPAEIERRAKVIAGVKRSTGQHPGGIVVVPFDHTITEVTPVQYPADDVNSAWRTTHFDYHAFEANLFKLDVLGHDDPTMIRFLMDFAKENPIDFPFTDARDIPLDDPKVYALLSGTEVIGLKPEDIRSDVASYGVPEMGTNFVRGMLKAARPKTFADIVKISGLSHGTDVWLNNAEMLVSGKKSEFGTIPFEQVIGCRDDIMVTLIQYGLKHEVAFEISEFIRRGRPLKEPTKWEGYQRVMEEHQIPAWYIWSCGQIQYMFPKAHATAYVMMALRIAWFKVHRPLYFYAAYFSKRAKDFDLIAMIGGERTIETRMDEILAKNTRATETEKRLLTVLEVALEMTKRGYHFESIDIHTSQARDFVITKSHGLRMPFSALEGLGEKVALSIVTARDEKPFQSQEDLKTRTQLTKTSFDRLLALDALKDLPEDSQMSLFEL